MAIEVVLHDMQRETRYYKRITSLVSFFCICLIVLNIWTYLNNSHIMKNLKLMSQRMIDLKVELEMMSKAGGQSAWAHDAVTYSTSGEQTPGIHLSGADNIYPDSL